MPRSRREVKADLGAVRLRGPRDGGEQGSRVVAEHRHLAKEGKAVLVQLVELAKQMRAEHERGANLGLRDDELASLRRHIRRLLTMYKYPPNKQEAAVLLVIQQAELFAAEQAAYQAAKFLSRNAG
jgi:Domain of unknown function (DUF3387)